MVKATPAAQIKVVAEVFGAKAVVLEHLEVQLWGIQIWDEPPEKSALATWRAPGNAQRLETQPEEPLLVAGQAKAPARGLRHTVQLHQGGPQNEECPAKQAERCKNLC